MNWQIGDVRVSVILEAQFPMPPPHLLTAYPEDGFQRHAEWMVPCFQQEDGQFVIAIQALLVETRGKRILVDTCMGNDRPLPGGFPPMQTAFLSDLEKLVDRRAVDYVLCTHLHFDHIGWNTMLEGERWVPTFPNARYLFGREEYEHWSRGVEDTYVDLRYAVDPIVSAGLHQLVEPGFRVTEEVWLESTPGHTPGHCSVMIESQGKRAIITGDMVHSPVQLAEPTWSSGSDSLPDVAVETRRRMVARLQDQPILVIGTHFPAPTAGYLVKHGASCKLSIAGD